MITEQNVIAYLKKYNRYAKVVQDHISPTVYEVIIGDINGGYQRKEPPFGVHIRTSPKWGASVTINSRYHYKFDSYDIYGWVETEFARRKENVENEFVSVVNSGASED